MADTQNVQTIKNAYAAYMRGDLQTILSSLTEDVEWTMPGEGYVPAAGHYRGHDGVRRFFEALNESSEVQDFTPREFVDNGDRVIVFGTYRGKARGTDRSYATDWVMVFTFRGEKVSSFQEYADTAAMAAAHSSQAKAA